MEELKSKESIDINAFNTDFYTPLLTIIKGNVLPYKLNN